MVNKQQVNIIVAVGNFVPGKGYAIGKAGKMPWHHSADMQWFKETTTDHVVIMGRKTFESMGSRPLPNRTNIVISSSLYNSDKDDLQLEVDKTTGVEYYYAPSLEKAVEYAQNITTDDIFIIGGASVYKQALDLGVVDQIYMDFLSEHVEEPDAFFPAIDEMGDEWMAIGTPIEIEKGTAYATVFSRVEGKDNDVDEQYLNLLKRIINDGEKKDTRAGTTYSIFGTQMRFNLRKGLPMLTTKKMFSKGVIHELLWFIRGETNIKYLVNNGVHIWDDDAYRFYKETMEKLFVKNFNSTKYYLYVNGEYDPCEGILSKEEFLRGVKEDWNVLVGNVSDPIETRFYTFGDLGPVYGRQWTNWNGHNQIHEVINTLKTNPDDRRMIISAWNVGELKDMALPPCHYSCQFYTSRMSHEERVAWAKENLEMNPMCYFLDFDDEDLDKHNVPKRRLSCLWNQRSVDGCLGLPFNIMSYALLTFMIAQCVNMAPGELIFNGGDTHIYDGHIEGAKKQLERNPHRFSLPRLLLNPEIKNIDEFTYDDIKIAGYKSYPAIKFPLSVGL